MQMHMDKENSSGAAKYRLHMHYLRLLHEIKSSPLYFLIHCVGDMKWPLDNKRTSSNSGCVFCGKMNRSYIRRCRELTGRTEGEKMAFDINGLTYFELESGFDLCKRASRALEVIVILPPPMTEGRVLSRRPCAAAHTGD